MVRCDVRAVLSWENVITFPSSPLAPRLVVEVDIRVRQLAAEMEVVLWRN